MSGPAMVLDAADVHRALVRIAHEVVERNKGAEGLVVVGIHTRGVPLARRLAGTLAEIEGRPVPAGALDVAMYRDDIGMRPPQATHDTELPFDLAGKVVVLVDDVLFSGRTIRAALDALLAELRRVAADLPRRRPGRLLYAARPLQRALRGAERAPRLGLQRPRHPLEPRAARGAQR